MYQFTNALAKEVKKMNEIICPSCERPIMTVKELNRLLRNTSSKVLLSHCICGEAYKIRSLNKSLLEISTSSGKRLENFIIGDDGEGSE